MKLWKSWVIASKDFSVFRKKKSIIYSVIIIPLLMSIILPFIISSSGLKSGSITIGEFTALLNAFSFFFVILAASLTTVIASYSLLGEKVEKSIEPLLEHQLQMRKFYWENLSPRSCLPSHQSMWV